MSITHQRMHTVRTSVVLLTLVFLLTTGSPAAALSAGGIGGHPAYIDPGIQYSDSWFIYALDRGESKTDAILLTNTSDQPETVKLYPVDSVATGDGNFSLKQEQDPREGVGAWITLDEDRVTLSPGEERTVSFTIRIPLEVDAGEHSGGIIIQKTTEGAANVGAGSASIVTRVGVRVYETVPGAITKKIEIKNFSVVREVSKERGPYFRASLTAQNQSNVSLKANATLRITGWGKVKYFPKSKLSGGLYLDFGDFSDFFKGEELSASWQLLRGQNVTNSWEWGMPAFGRFTFQAEVSYEGSSGAERLTSSPVTVWVMPWKHFGILGGILLLCLVILVWRKKPRQKKEAPKETVPAAPITAGPMPQPAPPRRVTTTPAPAAEIKIPVRRNGAVRPAASRRTKKIV